MMIETVLILGLFGFAGGYLAGHASLWEGWREKWDASGDAAYTTYFEQTDAGNRGLVPLAKGKFFEALTCQTCAGWHAVWIAIVVWVVFGDWPHDPAMSFIMWIAASGLHTFLMGVYDGIALSVAGRDDT